MKKTPIILAAAVSILTLGTAKATDYAIVQANQHFAQETITVKAGDKLVFKNQDEVNHDIIVITPEGDSEDKGIQKPGEDIQYVFAKPGVYKVRCNIHPTMKLNVTVQ